MTTYSVKELEKARDFATRKHEGQERDGGDPYINHPFQVAVILSAITGSADKDIELIQAGFLHDTIEDTDTTYEELVTEFGERVADLVMEVSHEGKKTTGYYFPRLKTKAGIVLKFADRISNLMDMNAWDKGRQEHYLRKSKFWKSTDGEPTDKQLLIKIANLERNLKNARAERDIMKRKLKNAMGTTKRRNEKKSKNCIDNILPGKVYHC